MAIRLSTARLAAAVANEGGIGLIAASGMEEQELRTEIRLARKLTNGKGIIGINCMVAARAFKNLIVTAAQEGVDLIVAGAGFSRDIFAVGREYNVAVVPIVSRFFKRYFCRRQGIQCGGCTDCIVCKAGKDF